MTCKPLIDTAEIGASHLSKDIFEEQADYIDEEIRAMQAKSLTLTVTNDHHGTLSLDSDILKGALGAAKDNGQAKAVNKDDGRRRPLNTSQHPEITELTAPSEEERVL